MADQTQAVQPIQKWYTKPQVIAIGATAAYLLLNKKTRKPTLALAGGAVTVIGIASYQSRDGFNQAIGKAFIPIGAALLWYGLRKKK